MLYVQFNHKEKDGNGLLINHVALVTCRKKMLFSGGNVRTCYIFIKLQNGHLRLYILVQSKIYKH